MHLPSPIRVVGVRKVGFDLLCPEVQIQPAHDDANVGEDHGHVDSCTRHQSDELSVKGENVGCRAPRHLYNALGTSLHLRVQHADEEREKDAGTNREPGIHQRFHDSSHIVRFHGLKRGSCSGIISQHSG